jgi:hypothetical protein
MTARVFVTSLLATYASLAFSADICPATQMNTEWSAQCFEGKGDARRVKPAFIKNLRLNQYGMTTILITKPRELVAVNSNGKVVIPGIRHTGDFDYPNAHLGIGRFYPDSRTPSGKPAQKCGYFQADRFRVIVPARFDHCQPFKEEQTLACTDCVSYCTETDCQDSVFVGGHGEVLGSDGRTRDTFPLPTLATVCTSPELVRIRELSTGAVMLRCVNGPKDPFNEL